MTKLEKMLKYVSEHNEFYKDRIRKYKIEDPLDIMQWPVLTRKELQENRYNMFSDGYKAKYFNQQLRRQSSSGSSGIPVNVYWDYKDWYASNMSLWRKRIQWYGIHPNDKYVMFTLNAFNVKNDGKTVYYINRPSNIISVNISLIQNDSSYEQLIDIINEFQPKWLYVQPFVLRKLIQIYKRTGKVPPKTLKYIESVGEILGSDLRRMAVEFFKVSFANLYGSEEMNGIAYECPKHHMHILEDNVFIETNSYQIDNQACDGEAIITNLNNFAMPLIRYNQKDQIQMKRAVAECACGSNSDEIEIIKGRTSERIVFSPDIEINSIILTELIAEVNNRFNDNICQYKFEYDKANNILRCFIKISSDNQLWYHNIKKDILITLDSKFFMQLPFQFQVCEYNQEEVKQKHKILQIKV